MKQRSTPKAAPAAAAAAPAAPAPAPPAKLPKLVQGGVTLIFSEEEFDAGWERGAREHCWLASWLGACVLHVVCPTNRTP